MKIISNNIVLLKMSAVNPFIQAQFIKLNETERSIWFNRKLRQWFDDKNTYVEQDVMGNSTGRPHNLQISYAEFCESVNAAFLRMEIRVSTKTYANIPQAVKSLTDKHIHSNFRRFFDANFDPIFSNLKKIAEQRKHAEAERVKQERAAAEELAKKRAEELAEKKRAEEEAKKPKVVVPVEADDDWE